MAQVLAINAALLGIVMLGLWQVSVRVRDVSFIDAVWPIAMVMLAWATFVQAEGAPGRMFWIALLTSVWGLRLGTHLYLRWRKQGEDPRYAKVIARTMQSKGWSFAKTAGLQVFAMQAVLLFVVCLPAQLGQIPFRPSNMGTLATVGVWVALAGIAFEAVGDWQLMRFRQMPGSKGKVLDTGLWRFTRHPNYFGDALTWWGIWLVAAETTVGLVSVIGPITITYLLTRVSGVPLLERGLKKSRPGYEAYVRRTSSFVPMLPKF